MIWENKEKYFSSNYQERYSSLEKAYLSSQYVKKNPAAWIPDETIYAYNAGAFIKGVNPVLINPEVPPLGKYLTGVSVLIFNNENLIILISGIMSLFLLYFLGRQVFTYSFTAVLPLFLLSMEPLFKNQFVYVPLFDIFQLSFLLAIFYFFNKGLRADKHFYFFFVASIFLGAFMATKFFASGITIIIAALLVLLFNKKYKEILFMPIFVMTSILILLLSYVKVFSFGYNLHNFLGIQKWVFFYHKGQLIQPFSVWPLLLFNQWHTWWGDKSVMSDPQWQIAWPILIIIFFLTTILYFWKKLKTKIEIEILIYWCLSYLLFLSLGQITTRYFVILFPILYLVAVYGIEQGYIFLNRRIKSDKKKI